MLCEIRQQTVINVCYKCIKYYVYKDEVYVISERSLNNLISMVYLRFFIHEDRFVSDMLEIPKYIYIALPLPVSFYQFTTSYIYVHSKSTLSEDVMINK